MTECGCTIDIENGGIVVRLCGAHSHGPQMLKALQRLVQVFDEVEERFRIKLAEAYWDTIEEARAIIRKAEGKGG